MENAVSALKIAAAIFIFILGLTMLFTMTSKAKETAEILISRVDKTKYYTYKDEEIARNSVDENGNRIVELKDIIPAIYRYSEENYGVTIVDHTGEIAARFDLDTEIACSNWIYNVNDLQLHLMKYNLINETNSVFQRVNTLANSRGLNTVNLINLETSHLETDADGKATLGTIVSNEGMTAIFERLYGQQASLTGTVRRRIDCKWLR